MTAKKLGFERYAIVDFFSSAYMGDYYVKKIYELRFTDTTVIANSFTQAPSYSSHLNWVAEQHSQKNPFFILINYSGDFCGYIRGTPYLHQDKVPGIEIHLAIVEKDRKKGLGQFAVTYFSEHIKKPLYAVCRSENTASCALFSALDFQILCRSVERTTFFRDYWRIGVGV